MIHISNWVSLAKHHGQARVFLVDAQPTEDGELLVGLTFVRGGLHRSDYVMRCLETKERRRIQFTKDMVGTVLPACWVDERLKMLDG